MQDLSPDVVFSVNTAVVLFSLRDIDDRLEAVSLSLACLIMITRRKLITGGVAAAALSAAGIAFWSKDPEEQAVRASGPGRFSSRDGLLEAEFAAAEAHFPLAGTEALGMAFNGQMPGPLLEARPGDTIRLRLENRLPDPTNLHYHGLHVSPSGNADNIFISIPTGESQFYEFEIPKDHPAGLFWYHPHLHPLVADHLSQGLAGLFVIRGELDQIPEIAAAREHFMVLQDWDLGQDGRVLGASMPERMMTGREGSIITVNGEDAPILNVRHRELLRLRLLNASSSRFYLIDIEGRPMHLAATDGGALPNLQTIDRLLLTPGERADILFQGAEAEGELMMRNLPYDRGSVGMMGGMGGMMGGRMGRGPGGQLSGTVSGQTVLARIRNTGRTDRESGLPKMLIPVEPLPKASATRTFSLGMRMGMGMMMRGEGMFTINGRTFEASRIDTSVSLGSVEEWEYRNETTMDHPMHLHTNPFQVIRDGEVERAWRDVIQVKAQSTARFRVAFRDFAGKTVQHCHILDHEDMGMMATVEMRG